MTIQSESFLRKIYIHYQYVFVTIVFHDLQCDCVVLRIENTQTFLHNTKKQEYCALALARTVTIIVECFKVYCTTKGVTGYCAITIENFKLKSIK